MSIWSLLAESENILWYLLPLAVCISLVYSASRYEEQESILRRAVRLFFQITIFMLVVFAVLWTLSFRL
jgi:hypothetical protein